MLVGVGADPSMAQLLIAKSEGYFERAGLDVQLIQSASSGATVPMLIGNQINATISAESSGITTHLVDNRVITAGEVLTFKGFYGLVARGAKNFDELKGKRVAVDNATNSGILWQSILEKNRLNPADYTVVQVQPPEMMPALMRKDVDAMVTWEPWISRAEAQIKGATVLSTNEGIMEAGCYMYMNREWAQTNAQAARAFVLAITQATDFINKDPQAAARITAAQLKMDPALTASLMAKLNFSVKLDGQTRNRVSTMAEKLTQAGRLKSAFNDSDYYYPAALMSVAPESVSLKD